MGKDKNAAKKSTKKVAEKNLKEKRAIKKAKQREKSKTSGL